MPEQSYEVNVRFIVKAGSPTAAAAQVRGELRAAGWYDGWTLDVGDVRLDPLEEPKGGS